MKRDGRTLDHKTLEHIRRLAVERVRNGESPSAVVASFGFSRTSIYRWLGKDDAGLASKKAAGPNQKLSVRRLKSLKRTILRSDPRSHGFESALWSTGIVAELIQRKYNVSLSRASVSKILNREGITPRKPLRRAYERNPELVEEWKLITLPLIVRRAKKRGALILFLDESGIVSDGALGTTWGQSGERTIVKTSGQRQRVNVISGVSPTGEFRYEVYTQKFNAAFFVDVLSKFRKRLRRPVFFIVDRHPAHRAKIVRDYVQSSQGKVELYFLPPYAPDLNPDEFVWTQIKTHGLCKKPLMENESLRERVIENLEKLANNTRLTKSFFKAECVAYPT